MNNTDIPTNTFTPARLQGAALSTAEINQISEKSHIDAFEEDDLFSELQSLWDEQSRRVDQLLAEHPASQPLDDPQMKAELYKSVFGKCCCNSTETTTIE